MVLAALFAGCGTSGFDQHDPSSASVSAEQRGNFLEAARLKEQAAESKRDARDLVNAGYYYGEAARLFALAGQLDKIIPLLDKCVALTKSQLTHPYAYSLFARCQRNLAGRYQILGRTTEIALLADEIADTSRPDFNDIPYSSQGHAGEDLISIAAILLQQNDPKRAYRLTLVALSGYAARIPASYEIAIRAAEQIGDVNEAIKLRRARESVTRIEPSGWPPPIEAMEHRLNTARSRVKEYERLGLTEIARGYLADARFLQGVANSSATDSRDAVERGSAGEGQRQVTSLTDAANQAATARDQSREQQQQRDRVNQQQAQQRQAQLDQEALAQLEARQAADRRWNESLRAQESSPADRASRAPDAPQRPGICSQPEPARKNLSANSERCTKCSGGVFKTRPSGWSCLRPDGRFIYGCPLDPKLSCPAS